MAVLTAAQLIDKINLYITTNGNKEITGAQVNEILQDMVDSGFLILDDPRTALSVAYSTVGNPADWTGGVAPATQNLVNDQIAARISNLESDYYSDSIAYVSKQGDPLNIDVELGNPAKPFSTIADAVTAMPDDNGVLIVLGGGFYNENVVLENAHNNCLYMFNNCRVNNLTAVFGSPENNNNIIKDLRIDNPPASTDIRATYVNNLRITNTTQSIALDSKYVTDCQFTSTAATATVATLSNFAQYHDNCVIINTGAGHAVRLSPNTIFSNCRMESGANNALDMQDSTPTIQEVYRLYNCTVKSTNIVISGDIGVGNPVNMLAYNCKFYSSSSNVLFIGDNSKFILFQGCEFYTKDANDVITMKANIVRAATDTYTFKECTFHTVTGYPLTEPVYGGGDAGNTLFLNCVYNAATATLAAPSKLTEHNSFSYPNYTDFNNLQ